MLADRYEHVVGKWRNKVAFPVKGFSHCYVWNGRSETYIAVLSPDYMYPRVLEFNLG